MISQTFCLNQKIEKWKIQSSGFLLNHDELIAELKLPPSTSDNELILNSYQKWQSECLEHLQGPISFVILDPEQQKLFAVRDPFGVQPLYYWKNKDMVVVSEILTEISGRLDFTKRIDELALVSALMNQTFDQEQTLLKNLRRLPAGHFLEFDCYRSRVQKYYHALSQLEELKLDSEQDYTDHYLYLLKTSIQRRLRQKNVGILLSSGIDSAALACVGQSLYPLQRPPFETFSLSFSDPEGSDQGCLDILNKSGQWLAHVDPAHVEQEGLELTDWDFNEDCGYWPTFAMFHPLLKLARTRGIETMWMGVGADEMLTPAPEYYADLLRSNRLWSLFREMHTGQNLKPKVFFQNAVKPLLPAEWTKLARTFIKPKLPGWIQQPHRELARYILDKKAEKYREASVLFPDWSRRSRYLRLVLWGGYQDMFEQQAGGIRHYDMQFAYPLLDQTLIEFSFQLPIEQLLWRGQQKKLLRQAMQGIMPEAVRLKPKFQDYSFFVNNVLMKLAPQFEPFLKDSCLVKHGFVKPQYIQDILQPSDFSNHTNTLLQCVYLEKWLRSI